MEFPVMSLLGRSKMNVEKQDYREFYIPPPIRNEVTKNCRYHNTLASPKRRSSLLVLNSHKVKVARLMTFSNLLQSQIKHKLKNLKHCDRTCKIETMFNCSDSGYGSGLGDIVTASGLENPDHVGWIMDLSCSQLRWCVVADMLFCVFENDFSEDPLNVLVLPGVEVKNLVYNSAKRCTIGEIDKLNDRSKMDTKTVSGMLRYQFILENHATGKSYAFGMDNKTDLEIWMSVLRNAVSLETDLFEDSSDSDYEDESIVSETSSELSLNRTANTSLNGSINSEPIRQKSVINGSISPSYYSPSRPSSGISDYSLFNPVQDGKSSIGSVSGASRLSGSHNLLLSKSCDNFEPISYVPSPRATQSRKEKADKNELNLQKDPNVSFDDEKCPAFEKVLKTASMNATYNTDCASDSEDYQKSKVSKALRKLSSVDDFRKRLRFNAKTRNENGMHKKLHKRHSSDNLNLPTDISDWVIIEDPKGFQKEQTLLTNAAVDCIQSKSSKMKKSNSFKEFFIGKQQKAAITLESVDKSETQGYLNHKQLLKWTKLWCVVHDDMFYAFKTQESDCVADISLVLKHCTIELVCNDKSKRIYTFKICGPNAKLYFSADTLNDHCHWLEVLKQKTNTTDLLQPKEQTNNAKWYENKQLLKTSKSKDHLPSKPKHRPLYRGISSSSIISGESYTSSISTESTKSTSSLTEMLKNYKNLYNGHNNNKEQQKHSHATSQHTTTNSYSDLPINEKVMERLRAQRKYSMPDLMAYSDIMEQAAESRKKDAKKAQSSSQLGKLLSSSKSKLAQRHSHNEPIQSIRNENQQEQNGLLQNSNTHELVKRVKSDNLNEPTVKSDLEINTTDGNKNLDNETISQSQTHNSDNNMVKSWISTSNYLPQNTENKSTLVSSSSLNNLNISSLPDRPDSCIFNRHLPGPNNEGLLLVRDDMDSTEKEKPILLHQRSYSDSNLNVTKPTEVNNTEHEESPLYHHIKSPRQPVVINLPAREVNCFTVQGYLDRKMEGEDDWVNIWGVLKEDTLFIYQSPIDECSVDSLNVTDWEIQQTDKMKDKHNVLVFKNDEFENQYYSSDSQSDFDHWKEDLHRRAKSSRPSRQFIEQKVLEETMLEELDQQKNELLKYVLSQRKQALKSIQSRRSTLGDSSSQDTDVSGSDATDNQDFIMVDDEQNWKDMTHLMQRKVSMQLKLDNLQRNLVEKKRGGTRKKFKLPFNKSSNKTTEEPNPEHRQNMTRQVRDLNSRLSYLQLDIEEKKQQMRPTNNELSTEIQDPLQFMLDRQSKPTEDKPSSKFKLGKKFNMSKFKNSFSTADVKTRSNDSIKNKSQSMSLRHSWSPDMWRNMKDGDLSSPASPESSTSGSSPDHKVSRLSMYYKRAAPRPGYLSSIKDLESPQEEPEELNMSLSSSNISQDTSYESSALKYDSNSSFMDTPMKDIVYRNNNKYTRLNDNEQFSTSHISNETVSSSDFEIDNLNGNTSQSKELNTETTAKIQEFEDFLKSRLGSG